MPFGATTPLPHPKEQRRRALSFTSWLLLSRYYPETIRIQFLHLSGGVRWGEVWWALPCISGLLLSGYYPESRPQAAYLADHWTYYGLADL